MSLQVAVREEVWGVKLSKPLLKPWDSAAPALSTGFVGPGEVPTCAGDVGHHPAGGSWLPGWGAIQKPSLASHCSADRVVLPEYLVVRSDSET